VIFRQTLQRISVVSVAGNRFNGRRIGEELFHRSAMTVAAGVEFQRHRGWSDDSLVKK
jgi:uncharacterized protein YfiM (DUF2279 family)